MKAKHAKMGAERRAQRRIKQKIQQAKLNLKSVSSSFSFPEFLNIIVEGFDKSNNSSSEE